jgi:hypothetical protein
METQYDFCKVGSILVAYLPMLEVSRIYSIDDRMINECGELVKWESAEEAEPPQCHFVHHKFHMDWPGTEIGPPRYKAGD